jgi:uncharacterized membrane protein
MAESKLKDIGPLQLLAVAFSQPDFQGKIQDELDKLRESKLIRIVDGMAVQKTETGKLIVMQASDLTSEENRRYGAVIGGLIGIGSGDAEVAQQTSDYVAEHFNKRYDYGLDAEDLRELAEQMQTGDAAIILLIEHVWAQPLRNAMREAGGMLLAQDFLSPELLISMGHEALSPEHLASA